jgi:hypothetical protein
LLELVTLAKEENDWDVKVVSSPLVVTVEFCSEDGDDIVGVETLPEELKALLVDCDDTTALT